MPWVTRVLAWAGSLEVMSAAAPGAAPSPPENAPMNLFEVETSFGVIAAGEQALIDAIREVLLAEQNQGTTPDELAE